MKSHIIVLAILLLVGLSLGIYVSILYQYYRGIVYTLLIVSVLAYLIADNEEK